MNWVDIFGWFSIFIIVLGMLFTIAMVGKPRPVITGPVAAWTVFINFWIVVTIYTLLQR